MPTGPVRHALFLDRDGVINTDSGYVGRIADMHFMPGIFELVGAARSADMAVVVVTNQSGIGRGLFNQSDFRELTAWMLARFAAQGVPIDRVYHCPYHPEAPVPEFRIDHPWRKPEPGMLLQARTDMGLDLSASVMIGDKTSDMEAAAAAGVGLRILLGDTAFHGEQRPYVTAASLDGAIAILHDWLH